MKLATNYLRSCISHMRQFNLKRIALTKTTKLIHIRIIFLIAILTIVIQPLKSHPTSTCTVDKWRLEIEALNDKIEQLFIRKNINMLVGLYADEFTYFPEYKPAIFKSNELKEFLTDWFKAANIKTYKKKIYQVEVYSGYVLEMGTFRFDYFAIDKKDKEYEGHYMILWKRNGSGRLSIVSETFGANKYIEPQDVPYASVKLVKSSVTPTPRVIDQIYTDVLAFDAIVLKAVAEGDGDARAKGFTEDAILMANFDSIRVGMEAIRPKMLKTYTMDVSYKVNHTYFRVYDLGEYVFVTSHYKGGWGDTINGGRFEGNISNLMKRNGNGKLLMHRQAGNRDSALVTSNQ